MPRQQRILSSTGIYHIMLRGNERKSIFMDNEDRQRFLETMSSKKEEVGFSLLSFCLMDNHVHLLIREGREQMSVTMKRICTSYVHYFNHKYNRIGHLFQDRFKSVPIEDERYLLAVVRYIHQNPVKAAIVHAPSDYCWSSYTAYIDRNSNHNIDTTFVLSIFSDDKTKSVALFKEFMEQEGTEQFLDVEEEKTRELQNITEVTAFLEEYAKGKQIEGGFKYLKNDRKAIDEAILELRKRSKLSVRQIAELLDINRGMVQRIRS